MDRSDIASVLRRHPDLNDGGFRPHSLAHVPASKHDAAHQAERDILLNSAAACTRVCEWLATKWPCKPRGRRPTTYHTKHLMEAETRYYVTDGAFIVAAIHAGYDVTRIPRSSSARVGIDQRSLQPKPVPPTERARVEDATPTNAA